MSPSREQAEQPRSRAPRVRKPLTVATRPNQERGEPELGGCLPLWRRAISGGGLSLRQSFDWLHANLDRHALRAAADADALDRRHIAIVPA